jgi:hypothetical protein
VAVVAGAVVARVWAVGVPVAVGEVGVNAAGTAIGWPVVGTPACDAGALDILPDAAAEPAAGLTTT